MKSYDYVIIGGGIFGVYASLWLSGKSKKVLLIEKEKELMQKASIVNQARLHSGYHYPRSIGTASLALEYKDRFIEDHKRFINSGFDQYYAIDKYSTFTDSCQYERFCKFLGLKAEKASESSFINPERISELYLSSEYSFDPIMIAEFYKEKLSEQNGVKVITSCTIKNVQNNGVSWILEIKDNENNERLSVNAYGVINATYSGTNTINKLFNIPQLELVHELTEMAFYYSKGMNNTGLTVMDGQHCSIMPYGLSGLLSLSSVTYTPHKISYGSEPVFDCQMETKDCVPDNISICNKCKNRPRSNKDKMLAQFKKYITEEIDLSYMYSMYTVKTKLKSSYIDDGRPTKIGKLSSKPEFYCVLAGKINSIYEIERIVYA